MPMNAKNSNFKRGFTIVELVIMIAVLGILVGILVPTFSGAAETARQKALQMDIENAYASFRTDCGFRNEPYLDMSQYTFLPEDALEFRPGNSTPAFLSNGYQWSGQDKAKVDISTPAQLQSAFNAKTVVYGPFNHYYLLGFDQAYPWTGEGTAQSPYLIQSYRDLRNIGVHVARGEHFQNQYFRLETNVSIADDSWLPIGGYLSPTQFDTSRQTLFSGTFDGNGHVITLSYGRVARDYYCLFGLTDGATICNLRTDGDIDIGAYAGGIIGAASKTVIVNCESAMTVAGDCYVGGIVGSADTQSSFVGCVNTGSLTAYGMNGANSNNAIGGIAGAISSNTRIENCRNEGQILGMGGTAGGIVGHGLGTIQNCVNSGDVTVKSYASNPGIGTGTNDSFAGGIAGYGGYQQNHYAVIDGCLNTGSVTAAFRTAGGIVGAGAKSITNCANTGAVSARGYVGGIAGVITNAQTTIANVVNAGTVAARGENNNGSYTGPVGGIIGHVAANNLTLRLAVSGGQVHYRKDAAITSYDCLGMFVGSANGTVTLSNAYLSISGGATIGSKTGIAQNMGSGITVSGSPTTQTSQNALKTALNSAVGSTYRSWAIKSGYLDNICLPTPTHTVTYDMGSSLPTDRQPGLALNTAFVGAGRVYLPFPNQTVVVVGAWQYTFQGWSVNSSTLAPGSYVDVSADMTITANWNKEAYTMAPTPFD